MIHTLTPKPSPPPAFEYVETNREPARPTTTVLESLSQQPLVVDDGKKDIYSVNFVLHSPTPSISYFDPSADDFANLELCPTAHDEQPKDHAGPGPITSTLISLAIVPFGETSPGFDVVSLVSSCFGNFGFTLSAREGKLVYIILFSVLQLEGSEHTDESIEMEMVNSSTVFPGIAAQAVEETAPTDPSIPEVFQFQVSFLMPI